MKKAEESAVICERCGHVKGEKPHVTEAVKKEYIRSILSEKPFSHTYALYDGAVEITFEGLRGTFQRDQDTRFEHYLTIYEADSAKKEKYKKLLLCASTLRQVVCISEGKRSTLFMQSAEEAHTKLNDDMDKFDDEIANKMDQIMCAHVKELSLAFSQLCVSLMQVGFDLNFWKGVGVN